MGLKPLKIQWAHPAEDDLDALLSYIAFEDPDTAKKLFVKVMASVEQAAAFPEIAPFIPELGHSYRELRSIRPFRIIYRITQQELRIIGILRVEQAFDPMRFLDH